MSLKMFSIIFLGLLVGVKGLCAPKIATWFTRIKTGIDESMKISEAEGRILVNFIYVQ